VDVGIDGPVKAATKSLRGAEAHLEAGDEIQVDGVEVPHQRSQLGPGPGRNTTRHPLTSAVGRLVIQHDPVIGDRHLDEPRAGRHAPERSEKPGRLRSQIAADLDERHQLPILRERRIEAAERVSDTAPLLDRRRGRIAAVNLVPHHRADHADLLHA
jgi:hypothetical protein